MTPDWAKVNRQGGFGKIPRALSQLSSPIFLGDFQMNFFWQNTTVSSVKYQASLE